MVMWSLLKRREKERPQRSSPGWIMDFQISGMSECRAKGKKANRERERAFFFHTYHFGWHH